MYAIRTVHDYIHMYVCINHSMIIPGLLRIHGLSSPLEPRQLFPPQEDAGLLHLLVQLSIPSPHVLLHDPHVHELHPPSTTQ